MRIATKISAGYAVLIALMLVVVIYQVSLIHRMREITEEISLVDFKAAVGSLHFLRDLDRLEELTREFASTGDPQYYVQMQERKTSLNRHLDQIERYETSPVEREEIERLSRAWAMFLESSPLFDPAGQRLAPEVISVMLPSIMDHFSQLRVQAGILLEETQQSIEEQTEKIQATGRRAEWISWGALIAGLGLGCLILYVIVTSISRPLHELTQGTRRLAAGDFSSRVNDAGNDDFAELAKDFNLMVQRLDELDSLKKGFVSHVSHEMKAPLASMQETSKLLLEEIPGKINEKQARLLELNLQSAQRLSTMIGNLLDLSRMEAGAMDYVFEPVDLGDVTQMVSENLKDRAQEKKLDLTTYVPHKPVIVNCDEQRIAQVLDNLINNAVNFSPQGGKVIISLNEVGQPPENLPAPWTTQLVTANGTFALLSVSDSGPGVPDAHKNQIFDRFHQVIQGKKMYGQGTGLGLAISRRIVEAHEGAIWVEDKPGGGSVFFVLLERDRTATDNSKQAVGKK